MIFASIQEMVISCGDGRRCPCAVFKAGISSLVGSGGKAAHAFGVGYKLLFSQGNDPASILLQCRSMVALLGIVLGALIFALLALALRESGWHVFTGALCFLSPYAGLRRVGDHRPCLRVGVACVHLVHLAAAAPGHLGRSDRQLAGFLLAPGFQKMSAAVIAPIAVVLVRLPWPFQPRTLALAARKGKAAGIAPADKHVRSGRAHLDSYRRRMGHHLGGVRFQIFRAGLTQVASDQIFDRLLATDQPIHGVLASTFELCRRAHLLPQGYLFGAEDLVVSERRASFMDGHWNVGGSVWFFPYAFWAKTPAALFMLLPFGFAGWWLARRRETTRGPSAVSSGVLSAVALAVSTSSSASRASRGAEARKPFGEAGRLYEAVPFMALFVIYAAVAMWQDLNIGFRHILALYPASFISWRGPLRCGGPCPGFGRESPPSCSSAGLWPIHFRSGRITFAYFNGIRGRPVMQGYLHLVDSSLDWGQDLPGLKRWLTTHDPDDSEPVFLSYFGTADPDYYGIKCERLLAFPEWRHRKVFACTPGYYAISATMFQNLYTKAFGPWNRIYERAYQATLHNLDLSEGRASRSRWPSVRGCNNTPPRHGRSSTAHLRRFVLTGFAAGCVPPTGRRTPKWAIPFLSVTTRCPGFARTLSGRLPLGTLRRSSQPIRETAIFPGTGNGWRAATATTAFWPRRRFHHLHSFAGPTSSCWMASGPRFICASANPRLRRAVENPGSILSAALH